ncbi:MAG: DUF1653 domain-containing protein [Ruminococcaceae bacterium]|nr:DUF1653 domain-containing protein [Oscillospiraceae bacterium]
MKQAVEVVAALISRQENGVEQIMICQRPAQKARGLLWEFVGGKIEEGETGEEALKRECMEELRVPVSVLGKYAEVTHNYPDITVHLTLYRAEITEGEPVLLEHADLRWITPEEIPSYPFCPADRELLRRIRMDYAIKTVPVGVWRHFKGKPYEVVGIACHSETEEPMVVYRALYGAGELWTRPVAMWNQAVELDGKSYPRFTYEGEGS